MIINQQLSVIILSRNRQQYLRRQIIYWKNYSIPVIIVDQSPEPLDQTELKTPLHIRYFHQNESFFQRLSTATKHIQTPYSIFLPDDEFHIESCLLSCLEFLNTHDDYVSCAGRSVAFQVDTQVCGYTIYEKLRDFKITSENPFERVKKLAHPYKFQPIHAVSKTTIWRQVASFFDSLEAPSPDMFELFFGFTAAYYGKLNVIPELMNMRSRENEPVHTSDWNQKKLLPVWLFEEENIEGQLSLYKRMSEMEDVPHSTKASYAVALSVGIIHYLSNSRKLVSTNRPARIVKLVKENLGALLPKSLYYLLKNVKHSAYVFAGKKSIKRESLMTVCKKLETDDKVKVDFQNVLEIQQLVEAFHQITPAVL
jgi:glycosyltransferase domain-containing protein